MAVLGERRRYVSVVMLDLAHRTAGGASGGPPARPVARVPVGGKRLGTDAGKRLQMRRSGLERLLRAEVFHVADVL